MQKLINIIALLSGLTSLSVIGLGVYVHLNQEAWQERARERLTEIITDGVTDALPDLLDGAMPEMPKATGPAIPSGPALPF